MFLLGKDVRGDRVGEALREPLALLLGERPTGKEMSWVTEHWGETAWSR